MYVENVAPLNSVNELQHWENRPFVTTIQSSKTQSKDPLRSIKKKVKRLRTAFTTGQLNVLENSYKHCKYINAKIRQELAAFLKISEKTIKVWFQNRRMKERREKQEECYDNNFTEASKVDQHASVHTQNCVNNQKISPAIASNEMDLNCDYFHSERCAHLNVQQTGYTTASPNQENPYASNYYIVQCPTHYDNNYYYNSGNNYYLYPDVDHTQYYNYSTGDGHDLDANYN